MTADHCACCGQVIPEGRQVCFKCTNKYPPTTYNPVYQAYKVLVDCKNGEESIAIEEAIGYLGEALA